MTFAWSYRAVLSIAKPGGSRLSVDHLAAVDAEVQTALSVSCVPGCIHIPLRRV